MVSIVFLCSPLLAEIQNLIWRRTYYFQMDWSFCDRIVSHANRINFQMDFRWLFHLIFILLAKTNPSTFCEIRLTSWYGKFPIICRGFYGSRNGFHPGRVGGDVNSLAGLRQVLESLQLLLPFGVSSHNLARPWNGVSWGAYTPPPQKKKVKDRTLKSAVLQKENHLLNF